MFVLKSIEKQQVSNDDATFKVSLMIIRYADIKVTLYSPWFDLSEICRPDMWCV